MNLSEALALASKMTSNRLTLPILGTALLTPTEEGIEVRATDLQMEWRGQAKGCLNAACCAKPRILAAAIKGMAEPSLSFAAGKLSVDGLEMRADPGDEFPASVSMDGAGDWPLAGDWLEKARRVAVAAAREDSRPVLMSVLCDPGTALLVAADGFRLRIVGEPTETGVLIPADAIRAAPDDAHTLRLTGSAGRFVGKDSSLTTALISGNFPPYGALIPKSADWSFTCKTAELSSALEACWPIAENGSGIIRLVGSGDSLSINVRSEEEAQIHREIAAQITGDVKIALNMRYLADALVAVGEEFCVSGSANTSMPVLITDGDYREVIMPMFVEWRES